MKYVFALQILLLFSLRQELCSKVEGHGTDSKSGQVIVQGNNNFALKLLNFLGSDQSHGHDKNLFFSPTSLSVALATVFLGANHRTAEQIAKVFNWSGQKNEDIHTAFKDLHEAIHGIQHEEFELKLANRIWGQHDLHLVPYFTTAMKEFYGSEMTLSDFGRESERVTTDINQWVQKQTNGKIKDFLPPGMLNSDTKLALINAIYFKGTWKYEFDKQKTFRAPFYAFGNRESEIEVDMMSITTKLMFHFDEELGCRILQLPYSGDQLSMILILTEELNGLSKLEKFLTIEKFDNWTLLMINTKVSVALPKFHLNQQFELSDVLPKLGISDVFDASRADLSGISETTGLFVSNLIHKAHVEVNEKGTEAAAASGVVMMKRSLDMNEMFYADHPFLFLIRHHSSGSILFVGRLQQPLDEGENERSHTHGQRTSDEL